MVRFLSLLVFCILGILVVAFAVANRTSVLVGFDPFNPSVPWTQPLEMPLYWVMFFCVAAGVILGGIANWLSQGKWRKRARIHKRELDKLTRERDELRKKLAEQEPEPTAGAGFLKAIGKSAA